MKKHYRSLLLMFAFLAVVSVCPATENPVVVLETNSGDIVIELYPDAAPVTVENFLKYVNDGFYDRTVFHRVINNFMIQAGLSYVRDYIIYRKFPTYDPIINEGDNGLSNVRGTISTALSDSPDSATAQFFINQVDNLHLDHDYPDGNGYGHCVFGTVIEGMDVVDNIANTPVIYVSSSYTHFPYLPPAYIHTAYELPCRLSYCSDLTSSGQIDFEDFAMFALHWLNNSCDSSNAFCDGADLDDSGSVDLADMGLFWDHWAQTAGYERQFSDLDPEDNTINAADFSVLSGRWLNADCQPDNNYCDGADINRDGTVDITDFATLIDNWLMPQ